MGVIGTAMGLVQVLSNMTDAKSLTESIGVAFIATLYGVVFANLIYMPLANQLKVALKREKIFKQMKKILRFRQIRIRHHGFQLQKTALTESAG